MQIAINPSLYGSAEMYAQKQGINVSELIERFLERFISSQRTDTEQAVPDIVLSLLGAGESVDQDDLNGRKAYYQYLEEKYQ